MSIRILFVDDEPSHLELAKEYLEDDDELLVDCASSAREAIIMMEKTPYQAVISDYCMDEIDGIAFLKMVRERFGPLPFILFTGKGEECVVIAALNNGADYYIKKGEQPDNPYRELKQKIKQAVARAAIQADMEVSQKLFSAVMRMQEDFILRIDSDLTVLSVNDGYSSYYQIDKENAIGTEFLPDCNEENRAKLIAQLQSLSPEHPSSTTELSFAQKDGSVTRQKWTFELIEHENTDILKKEFIAVGRDITQMKTVEENLTEHQEKYLDVKQDLPKNIQDFDENVPLNFLIENIVPTGNYKAKDLFSYAKTHMISAIASVTGSEGSRFYLIFLKGEPEGAVYIDKDGPLYGDKSIRFLDQESTYQVYPLTNDTSRRLITGCRIFDTTHLKAFSEISIIPDIRPTAGRRIGTAMITIQEHNNPVQGVTVAVKQQGKIVGTDMTSGAGEVRFQLLFGTYDGVIHASGSILKAFRFDFKENNQLVVVDLN